LPAPASRSSLVIAALSALGVAALYLVFVANPLGQLIDTDAMHAVMSHASALRAPAARVLDTITLRTVLIGTVAAAIVALLRRRPATAAAALAVVGAANLTTQLLKVSLSRPWALNGDTNSLPSGHVTAAASVVAAALLVTAPRWRWMTAAIGATWLAAVSAGVVVAGWHRPSDVAAALLVTASITALTTHLLRHRTLSTRHTPPHRAPATRQTR
jgi:membrane-associated phospholipid phosphatase